MAGTDLIHKTLNLVVAASGLALPAVGIWLIIEAEKIKGDDSQSEKYNLYLALGIAFIIAGAGPVIGLMQQGYKMLAKTA